MALETGVEKAKLAGKSILIEMDANAKLGKQYIPKGRHEMSPNGTILASIVERQHLIVANGYIICEGTITRTRAVKNRVEKSVIDIVLCSKDLLENLGSLKIDEKREHVLTEINKTKKGLNIVESDPIITKFNLSLEEEDKQEKIEVFNLKNPECQQSF